MKDFNEAGKCRPGEHLGRSGCHCLKTLCPAPLGLGEFCADTSNDPLNCGACNRKCSIDEVCVDSVCAPKCSADEELVNGKCLPKCPAGATRDSSGTCQCPSGEHLATGFNRCDPDCTGVQVNDPQTGACVCPVATQSCNGQCVDTLTDTNNCGTCGIVCPSGASCNSGSCQCTNANQEIVTINGQKQCAPKCPTGATRDPITGQCNCPSEQQVCGVTDTSPGTCTDLQSDINNCGACSNVCTGGGQTCQSGSCQCPADKPNLVNGQCTACSEGYTDCGDPLNPVCNNLQVDTRNCGACGNVCPTGAGCIGGQCQCPDGEVPGTGSDAGTCVQDCSTLGPGFQYCSNYGQCIDTNGDSLNCGQCGNKCTGGQSCVNGACAATIPHCYPDQNNPGRCFVCGTGDSTLCTACISVSNTCP
jgi:hypothetical protein